MVKPRVFLGIISRSTFVLRQQVVTLWIVSYTVLRKWWRWVIPGALLPSWNRVLAVNRRHICPSWFRTEPACQVHGGSEDTSSGCGRNLSICLDRRSYLGCNRSRRCFNLTHRISWSSERLIWSLSSLLALHAYMKSGLRGCLLNSVPAAQFFRDMYFFQFLGNSLGNSLGWLLGWQLGCGTILV